MICPDCGTRLYVDKTEDYDTWVRRLRKCSRCDARWYTTETLPKEKAPDIKKGLLKKMRGAVALESRA